MLVERELYRTLAGLEKKALTVKNVNKFFDDVHALADVTLEVRAGEFFTLLGPSGCGKTTLLRIIAGLEMPDTGQILLGGDDISRLPAARRQVNTVFQSYALFPHLTIFENVAFGLRSRRMPQQTVDQRVSEKMDMLGLTGLEKRYPHQLSGGQKQRVALARALVNEPDVLLLDEPMSALDAKLRTQVQFDLRRLQRELQQTFILVTHDQDEAMAVSDRIAVMEEGRIIQYGTPEEVYERPQTTFVAEFLGAANLIAGTKVNGGIQTGYGFLHLSRKPSWEKGTIAIRPERIRLVDAKPTCNGLRLKVSDALYRGANLGLWLEPGPLRVRTDANRHFSPGEELWLELPQEDLVILDE